MSFDDFRRYFDALEICHLTPESVCVDGNEKDFEMYKYFGKWEKDISDGGCGNDGMSEYILN
jgi:hypothetical protein